MRGISRTELREAINPPGKAVVLLVPPDTPLLLRNQLFGETHSATLVKPARVRSGFNSGPKKKMSKTV